MAEAESLFRKRDRLSYVKKACFDRAGRSGLMPQGNKLGQPQMDDYNDNDRYSPFSDTYRDSASDLGTLR